MIGNDGLLKDITTDIESIETKIDIIDGNVDSILSELEALEYDIENIDGAIDIIDGKIDDLIIVNTSNDSSGIFSYLDAGGEQTITELSIIKRKIIQGIWLDLVNITQNGTIKLYYKIDGSNYREVDSFDFVVAEDPDGVYINLNMGITNDIKITYTEGAEEGAARNIPYSIIYQDIE